MKALSLSIETVVAFAIGLAILGTIAVMLTGGFTTVENWMSNATGIELPGGENG